MRINKFFTENGLCSRREADRMVEAGRISINGKVAKLGDQVADGDQVALDGKPVQVGPKEPVILAYNKPAGIECTSDPRVPENIIAAVNYPERIFHIGRLDKFSEGLILLTNIGELVNDILRVRYGHEKEYLVEANDIISDEALLQMSAGIEIMGRMTLPCDIERLSGRRFKMILTEGRTRQIRRMVEAVGLRVSRLRRIRVMNIELGEIPKGQWRKLSVDETKSLTDMIQNSKSRPLGSFEEEEEE